MRSLSWYTVRTLRREPALTQFETAQIANLCPATAEEAKSIIPRCVIPLQSHILTTVLPWMTSVWSSSTTTDSSPCSTKCRRCGSSSHDSLKEVATSVLYWCITENLQNKYSSKPRSPFNTINPLSQPRSSCPKPPLPPRYLTPQLRPQFASWRGLQMGTKWCRRPASL